MERSIYKNRRKKVLSMMKDGLAIIPAASFQTRSNDTTFPFRQNSHFYYLTGFNEDNAILVLCNNHPNKKHAILFVEAKDPLYELWNGERTGVKKAQELTEADEVHPISEFDKLLPDLLKKNKNLYIDLYNNPIFLEKIIKIACSLKGRIFEKPRSFQHINLLIEKLRVIKDQHEIKQIRRAVEISEIGHMAMMKFVQPGMQEKDLANLAEYIFKQEGADSVSYETIVATGNNANTLHYVKNDQTIKKDDLVLIDAGAEYKFYAGDITRTIPASGKFSSAQKDLYQLVLTAQKEATKMVRPNIAISDINKKVHGIFKEGLKDLKIIKKNVNGEELDKAVKKYYPHGTSHWIGMDVHDQNPHFDNFDKEIKLAKGMVISVEPGLYCHKHDLSIPKHFRGIGIRIEDDVLLTESGHDNLVRKTPKEIKDIEEFMQD